VIFDDHLLTVISIGLNDSPPDYWAYLCLENSMYILGDQETSDNSPISLNDPWLTTQEISGKQRVQVESTSIKHTYDTNSVFQGKTIDPAQLYVTLDIKITNEILVLQTCD
jgi:hypothetical protein